MVFAKYGVYRAEFPAQSVTKREGKRSIPVTGGEMCGPHRCVVVAVDPDNQFAVVCPMTSAQDTRGGEKWQVPKKTWVRVIHLGKPAYILTEQIRYADATRFYGAEDTLGQHDRDQLDLKLKVFLGLV
jgi:mRNA-degrading endonuclease toxin of MazEF toxin-antitoxin module